MYDVWFESNGASASVKGTKGIFVSGVPTYELAARIVVSLEEEFDVYAWIEKD